MPDRTLLIPGTGGTQLWKNGVSLGHPKVLNAKLWLFNTIGMDVEQTVADMSMEHRPGQIAPVKSTLADASEVVPQHVLTAAYNQILPRVDEAFVYDWRGDIEFSAKQLIDKLTEADLGGGKWKIVSHSQGGLVALAASQLYKALTGKPFSTLVKSLCLVAAPVRGALDSASALIEGRDLGAAAVGEFRKIAGTWPAIYQMLPDWRALVNADGSVSPFTFLHTKTWKPYPWVSPDLVRRAVEFKKKYMRFPVAGLAGIDYSFMLFSNKPTWDHALRAQNGLITFGNKSARGDGLVPSKATIGLMDDVSRQHLDLVGPEENNAEHAMLLNDDFVATLVMKRFQR
jgi:pimeloyl-ACP methyl ester carboxylesterase